MMSGNNNFNNLDPSEVLEPSSLQAYEAGLNVIWRQLLRLNANLFVLKKLVNFPYDLVIDPQHPFFELVEVALTENSILVITKLVTDQGKEKESIIRFKDWVREQIKERYKGTFDHMLSERRPDIKGLRKASKKIKPLRDEVIAHLIVDNNHQLEYSGDMKVAFQELDSICEQLNKLFDVLCFGHKYALLPLDYDSRVEHPAGTDPRPDIEYYLDLIVQDSHWYKRPDSQYWKLEREYLSQNELDLLNEYRKKFGQPEV